MNLLIIILALVNYVRNDGYGRPTSEHTPPRSHYDPFDPRSRFA